MRLTNVCVYVVAQTMKLHCCSYSAYFTTYSCIIGWAVHIFEEELILNRYYMIIFLQRLGHLLTFIAEQNTVDNSAGLIRVKSISVGECFLTILLKYFPMALLSLRYLTTLFIPQMRNNINF